MSASPEDARKHNGSQWLPIPLAFNLFRLLPVRDSLTRPYSELLDCLTQPSKSFLCVRQKAAQDTQSADSDELHEIYSSSKKCGSDCCPFGRRSKSVTIFIVSEEKV
jgi:hypothetical protein